MPFADGHPRDLPRTGDPAADPAQDAAALRRLRRWAERYAPLVATEGCDGLIADITGVAHLYGGEAMLRADLISRLGNRVGFDHVLRLIPADSLLPERSFRLVPAHGSAPRSPPFRTGPLRPLIIFPPEPVSRPSGHPPLSFRWRGRAFTTLRAAGPERIAPEWWRNDPAWASGIRDYWRIETREGPRLWLFHTPQAPAWHVAGEFP